MLQSYNIPERKNRTGDPHGGVIVYVKNGIFYKRREDLDIRGLECLWIEVIKTHVDKFSVDFSIEYLTLMLTIIIISKIRFL